MRIISGIARGTRLGTLPAPALRPMLDRVKESLFNIIRDAVPGANALDLFSGSGALGLEALSRGAARCTFVESDAQLGRLAMENARRCKLADRCVLVEGDVLKLAQRMPPDEGLPAGLIFVDPPYALVDDPNRRAELFAALEALGGGWIEPGALLVLHHRPIPYAIWPSRRLRESDKRIYGRSQLTFFDLSRRQADD